VVEATSGFGAHAIYLVAAIPLLVAIAVAVLVWRTARQERSSRTLWTSLADPSPTVRRGALDALTDDTMEHNAPLLCELLAVEDDPDVLDALAAAVARSRWEPTADTALLELRRWVAGGQTRSTRSSREPAPARTDPWAGVSSATPVEPTPPAAEPEPAPRREPVPTPAAAPAPATAPAAAAAFAAASVSSSDPPVDDGAHVADGLGTATQTARARSSTQAGEPSAEELQDLVPKVRAVLGDDLEHLELVSIDGTVLTTWSSGEHGLAGHDPEVV
jgi:hypothetical protein